MASLHFPIANCPMALAKRAVVSIAGIRAAFQPASWSLRFWILFFVESTFCPNLTKTAIAAMTAAIMAAMPPALRMPRALFSPWLDPVAPSRALFLSRNLPITSPRLTPNTFTRRPKFSMVSPIFELPFAALSVACVVCSIAFSTCSVDPATSFKISSYSLAAAPAFLKACDWASPTF